MGYLYKSELINTLAIAYLSWRISPLETVRYPPSEEDEDGGGGFVGPSGSSFPLSTGWSDSSLLVVLFF